MSDPGSRILVLLGGGLMRTQGIVDGTGVPRRTVYYHLEKLRRQGLIHQVRQGVWELTDKGRASLARLGPPVEGFSDLKRVLAPMPEGFQAIMRLALSAVVAKRHLFESFETGWPGFIAWGDTGLGKTFLGRLVGKLVGLGDVVKDCRTATERELLSRRIQVQGGVYVVQKSPCLDIPFLVLDEADKAKGEVRRGVFQLLQGDSYILIENERIPHRMIPYTTLNLAKGPGEDFAPYLRRCVAVDFDELGLIQSEVRAVVDKIPASLPLVDLDRLVPPCQQLPAHEKALLEEVMGACTKEDALWDRLPLEIMALGRAPFLGGDLTRAALDTCYDRLLALETLRAVKTDWRTRILETYRKYPGESKAEGMAVEPSPQPTKPPAWQGREEARLSFVGRKEKLSKKVEAAIAEAQRIPEELHSRPAAQELAGLAGEMQELEKEIKKDREEARLAWHERVVEERVQLIRKLLESLCPEEEAVKQRAALEAEAKAVRRARLKQLDRLAKECRGYWRRKETKPDEDVLGTLVRLGCVEWRTIAWEEEVKLGKEETMALGITTLGAAALAAGINAFINKEWEEYPFSDIYRWQQEPGHIGNWARSVMERLRRGDPSVQFDGEIVQVRKPKLDVFGKGFLAGEKQLEKVLAPKKVVRQRKALIGLDDKEYKPADLSWWNSPAVKGLLDLRLSNLELEMERLRQEV